MTGNLRAVQILLGYTKIENTVRYLGVDVEDALTLLKARKSDCPAPHRQRGAGQVCAHVGHSVGLNRIPQRDTRSSEPEGGDGWFAARQLSGDEPAEADAYSLSSRPSTTCVARSVAVDSITR